jgi:hypothetical protein
MQAEFIKQMLADRGEKTVFDCVPKMTCPMQELVDTCGFFYRADSSLLFLT